MMSTLTPSDNREVAKQLIEMIKPFVRNMQGQDGRPWFRKNLTSDEAESLLQGIYSVAQHLAAGPSEGHDPEPKKFGPTA